MGGVWDTTFYQQTNHPTDLYFSQVNETLTLKWKLFKPKCIVYRMRTCHNWFSMSCFTFELENTCKMHSFECDRYNSTYQISWRQPVLQSSYKQPTRWQLGFKLKPDGQSIDNEGRRDALGSTHVSKEFEPHQRPPLFPWARNLILPSLISTGWFKERIRGWWHKQTLLVSQSN